MKLGSLFDGSGGFPLAGVINGMEPVWASEIEPYPLKVTAARFPNMAQLGDVTKINGAAIEPVDVITFGSPCQDLSVAGKQAGIHDGVRSNLFFEAIRIVKEMRAKDEAVGRTDKHVRPRFAVWENVPGAFSSNKGADFQAVLQALCEVADTNVSVPLPEKGKWQKAGCIVGDGYSIAWRVYDAQFWGVPQRRKRIYLIADFGSERAGEILFEREGVRRDIAASHEAWEKLTAHAAGGFDGSGADEQAWCISAKQQSLAYGKETAATLGANGYKEPQVAVIPINEQVITRHNKLGKGTGFGAGRENDPAYTLQANHPHGVVYALEGNGARDSHKGNGWKETDTMFTPNTIERHGVVYKNIACCQNTGQGWWNQGEIAQTLRTPCGGDATKANHVVYDMQRIGQYGENGKASSLKAIDYKDATDLVCYDMTHANDVIRECQNVTPTLQHRMGTGGNQVPIKVDIGEPPRKYIVRRLTPLECCRLQGFPDWWEDGVEGSDSARYKMWGNGIALPCAVDVLGRIANATQNT